MEEDTIAIISQHGYNGRRRYSVESIEWLEWLNSKKGGRIQHGRNGGEKMAGKYQIDGLDEMDVYEYNGCIFHGCPACTDPDDYVPGSRKRMKDAYQQFQDKRIDLESRGYTVHEMWSCQ